MAEGVGTRGPQSWRQMIHLPPPRPPPPPSTPLHLSPPPPPPAPPLLMGDYPFSVNYFGWGSTPCWGWGACDKASANQRTALLWPCDWISDGNRTQSEPSHREPTNRDRPPGPPTHTFSRWALLSRGWKLWWLAAILRHEARGRIPGIRHPGKNRAVGERNLSWCQSRSLFIKLHLKLVLFRDSHSQPL